MSLTRRYDSLLAELQQQPRRSSTLLLAVDGCGGSGKSTFARNLAELEASIIVVHFDDFYLPSTQRPSIGQALGAEYDLTRLVDQVLTPLNHDQAAQYQRYDWITDRLAESHTIPSGSVVIVEGVYTLLLADNFDYTIWVDCPYELRLARGLARDGEAARSWWVDHWMPAEQRYIQVYSPEQRADLIVDGSAELGDEFATLREAKR